VTGSVESPRVDAWLTSARDEVAAAAGVASDDLVLDEDTAAALLDLARIAAHVSGARTNAPLLTYLVGVAVGRGGDVEAVTAAVRDHR
jgi:Domain of unknown function (DUF6457)